MGRFFFSGHPLEFLDSVTHLGHTLHCSLDVSEDIRRAKLEICKKAIKYCPKYGLCMRSLGQDYSVQLTVVVVVWWCSSHALNLNLWRSLLTMFSGESGGS